MRVFLAGATGAIRRRLVPAPIAAGHDVFGTTRYSENARGLRSAGADTVVVDPLDRAAVLAAVTGTQPEVVIHQLSALKRLQSFNTFDQELAETNRLRTEGLDILLEAAREAGARRFVAQSHTGWPNERSGGPVKTEAARFYTSTMQPLPRSPRSPLRRASTTSLTTSRHRSPSGCPT